MAVSSTSSLLLYAAAGFSAFTVAAHTQMGFDTVLPSIRKFNPADPGLVAAKIGWMELNQGFVLMSIMAVKWARHGITGPYEKAFAAVYSISQVFFGAWYARVGFPVILIPLWGIPGLIGLSQLV
ncbi:hypothetical protein H0G86_012346 [Trichoderma simmonsii]|uniref:Uncharacterized protein n=1 Tax=Trichoderma simmonsii TaxID=1491479 RepID=A0A8G0PLX9_9HYPO|nr:hypothetical protein H0G86_012346 [Trichoderma simmonsii]